MNKRCVLAGSALVASLGLAAGATPAVAAQAVEARIQCGDISALRKAVKNANEHGSGTIRLAKRCAYAFGNAYKNSTNALPSIEGNITIVGDESTLIRTGDGTYRLLNVSGEGRLTLKGITVSGGLVSGNGGGIRNRGTLRLEKSTVSGNFATDNGGGIANLGNGRTTLVSSRVLTNSVLGSGGGLRNGNNGVLVVKKSVVAGNSAGDEGGGIDNRGVLRVEQTLIASNKAYDDGGGIDNERGSATITHSRVSGNSANDEGGGVSNDDGGRLRTLGVTIQNNIAGDNGGGLINEGRAHLKHTKITGNQAGEDGGGVQNEKVNQGRTVITIEQSSIKENRAAGVGGGIHTEDGAYVRLRQSKVVNNRPDNCSGEIPNCN
jgi:hypothetical protein